MTDAPAMFNYDAEQAVLSACLMSEDAVRRVLGKIEPESFYGEAHRHVFSAMLDVVQRGAAVDPHTLSARLAQLGKLDAIGGKDYIGYLIDVVPTAANVAHHADIVKNCAAARAITDDLETLAHEVKEGVKTAREAAAEAFKRFLPYAVDEQAPGFKHAKELLWPVMEEIEARAAGKRGLVTGYAMIDSETNGFRLGELFVIGGAEKAGKSAIALNIALRVMEHQKDAGVGYVSAELTHDTLIERCLAFYSRVPFTAMASGKLHDVEFPALARAAGLISALPFYIDDEAEPSLSDIQARSALLKAEHPNIRVIVVDFLQLITARERGLNESVELKRIAYGLKKMAKQLGVLVIAPCQVNTKDSEDRKDMRPQLKDLQGSSGMRQAADFVALAYREGLYNELSPDADVLELNFAACRRTRRFTARLRWDGSTLRVNG